MAHANKVLSHRELLQAVWGPDYGDQVDYLRVFVNQLRKKIEANPSSPVYLLTEPWVGYRLQLHGAADAYAVHARLRNRLARSRSLDSQAWQLLASA